MQTWGNAYARLREQSRFLAWFGINGRLPGPNDFTYRAYNLVFSDVLGREGGVGANTQAPVFGPVTQIFNKGAVILAITSGAYQDQPPINTIMPIPASPTPARRDLYKIFLEYTDAENVNPPGPTFSSTTGAVANQEGRVSADALMGEGQKDEFPRDLLVPPSTGFVVKVQSFLNQSRPNLFIHVVFHCVVPKG